MNAKYWIEKLSLERHPEGGYYKETYRCDETLSPTQLPARFHGSAPFSTAIYFLLESTDFSALHSIASDEIWHFYHGSPLTIFEITENGERKDHKLGIGENLSPQIVITAGSYFGARVIEENTYALVGCTVSPGFMFDDFNLAQRESLLKKFPAHKGLIENLTRL